MSSFESQRQESLKRVWHHERRSSIASIDESFKLSTTTPSISPLFNYKLSNNISPSLLPSTNPSNPKKPTFSSGFDDDLVSAVVPPVTVVLEGRSICQRISLHKHGSYQSLARALRHMFVDINDQNSSLSDHHHHHHHHHDTVLDLSNAVPGYVIAYEDMENDLLLVGDLNWKDFVRVAKRIRILPAKAKSRKMKKELN